MSGIEGSGHFARADCPDNRRRERALIGAEPVGREQRVQRAIERQQRVAPPLPVRASGPRPGGAGRPCGAAGRAPSKGQSSEDECAAT